MMLGYLTLIKTSCRFLIKLKICCLMQGGTQKAIQPAVMALS